MKTLNFIEAWDFIEKELNKKIDLTEEAKENYLLAILSNNFPEEYELCKEYAKKFPEKHFPSFKDFIKSNFECAWRSIHNGYYIIKLPDNEEIEVVYVDLVQGLVFDMGYEEPHFLKEIELLSGKLDLDKIQEQYPLIKK